VAVGVNLAAIYEIVNEGAEIIVVGGAVSNAINKTEMA
jgi:3-keto-L-gulonate-6-phosphate decarboxylase